MQKVLKLSEIRLYLDNPRLSKSENEEESLYKIVEDQQRKIVQIAKDITKFGLSPLDGLAVFPDPEKGYYQVAEGNRRITALKLLENPHLIEGKYPSIAKEISQIDGRKKIDFDRINVIAFPSENDPNLIHAIELRHSGEQNGIGTVKWNSKQKGRFDYRVHGKANLVIFLDFLENEGILTSQQIVSVTKTNWERILRPVGLDFFRLLKESSTYKILPGCKDEFTQKIRLVADTLRGQTVGLVYGQKEIEEFFEKMEEEYLAEYCPSTPDLDIIIETSEKIEPLSVDIADLDTSNDGTVLDDNYSEVDVETEIASSASIEAFSIDITDLDTSNHATVLDDSYSGVDTAAKNIINEGNNQISLQVHVPEPVNIVLPGQKMPKDPFKNCPSVIPPSIRIQSRNHRINQIVQELKSLPVETYTNACGCLLRALIELCAKEYLEYNKHPQTNNGDATGIEFKDAIIAAKDDMVSKNKLSVAEGRAIKTETEKGGVRQLFNGYMHNTDIYPSSIVIKEIFHIYQKFLFACLY